MNIMKSLNYVSLILLVSIIFSITYSNNVYAYDPSGEWAKNILFSTGENIGRTFWQGSPPWEDSHYGFYPVEEWEVNICMNRLSTETSIDTKNLGVSQNFRENIYGAVTANINAKKIVYDLNNTLYQISWYIQPYDSEITYSVYLVKGNEKFWIPKKPSGIYKNVRVDPVQGDSGFYAGYKSQDYDYAVLESDSMPQMRTPIIMETP